MRSARRRRGVIWVFVISVEFGYLQSIQSGVTLWQWGWLCACGLVSGILGVRFRRSRKPIHSPRRFNQDMYFVTCVAIHLFGWLYGALWAVWLPGKLLDSEGLQTVVYATVTSTQRVRTGTVVGLHVYEVMPKANALPETTQGKPGTRPQRCDVAASWFVRSQSSWSNGLSDGGHLVLSGVLVNPTQVVSAPDTALARLFEAKPRYEFVGRLVEQRRAQFTVWNDVLARLKTALESSGQGTGQQRDVLLSLVFGGQSLDNQVKSSFLGAGVLHVLAASGANVLLVVMTLERLLGPVVRLLRLPYTAWSTLIIGATWCFAGLCGFVPSIDRAAWMTTHRYASGIVHRRSDVGAALGFSALAMALFQPGTLATIGALLSFVATAAVGKALDSQGRGVSPIKWSKKLFSSIIKYVREMVRVTFAIELYVTPLTLTFFQQLTPYAFLSNLLVEPVLICLMPITLVFFAAVLLTSCLPALDFVDPLLARLCFGLLGWLLSWVNAASGLPGALVSAPAPNTFCLVLYYSTLVFGSKLVKRLRSRHNRSGFGQTRMRTRFRMWYNVSETNVNDFTIP